MQKREELRNEIIKYQNAMQEKQIELMSWRPNAFNDTNLTLLRKAEQMLQTEKEKNEELKNAIIMKDEFLALITHEFKTPLTVINSAIQTLEIIYKNELSEKVKTYLNKIQQNANRQLKLVNNILDINRINAGYSKINTRDIDIVQLTKAITESILIFAERKNIKLLFSSTISGKIISIDDEKFERILLNLLSNAIKFTPEGKSSVISVMVSEKIIQEECNICIQVIDKGVGVPCEKQELIFQKFGQVDRLHTRQAEGTGIGLHLVKMFLELMGGEISLESKQGEGSTFTILLPAENVGRTSQGRPIESNERLIQAAAIELSDIYI